MPPETYIYQTWPFPFGIALLKWGCYAGGVYHEYAADQFVSHDLLQATVALSLEHKLPEGHVCTSCKNVCKNVKILGYCCDYEPMDGLSVVDKYLYYYN